MSTHELKHLQSRKTAAEKAISSLREELKDQCETIECRKQELLRMAEDSDTTYQNLKRRLHELESQISIERQSVKELEAEIRDLKSTDRSITISEHAILRYLQRVKGLDLDKIKKEILPPIIENQINSMGDGCYPADTHRIQIRDRVVVTILDTDMSASARKAEKKRRKRKKGRTSRQVSNARRIKRQEMKANNDGWEDWN